MKKFLLMIALLGLISFGFSTPASAGVHVSVGIGGPAYYGGPYYGRGYYPYGYGPAYYYGGPNVYIGQGYYPWYNGYYRGGYYRGGYYGHGGYYRGGAYGHGGGYYHHR